MTGYVYATPNESILEKLLNWIRVNNEKAGYESKDFVNHSLYDFYVVTDRKLDFKSFRFKQSKYYVQFIGCTNIKRWNYNNKDGNVIKGVWKSELKYENIKLCRGYKDKKHNVPCFILTIGDKYKYYLEHAVDALAYMYHRVEKQFFEMDWNLTYMDEANIVNNELFSSPENETEDVLSVDEFIDNADDNCDIMPENLTQYDHTVEEESQLLSGKLFDYQSFYNHYMPLLTDNYRKMVALTLLEIRPTHIAKLMNVEQPYVTAHMKWLGRRVMKIYRQTHIEFLKKEE